MLTKFWESVGEGLSEKWLGLLGPSLVFWVGGLVLSMGWGGVGTLSGKLLGLTISQQIIVLLGLLTLLLASASFIQYISYAVLRILEGYWGAAFAWLKLLFIKRQNSIIDRWELYWQGYVQKRSNGGLSSQDTHKLAELERKLHYIPSNPDDYMPTKLGNILRMAETQPGHKYGLDVVICWPRLWPLLSDPLREELGQSRKSLNQGVEFWSWGILFLFWSYWSWWAFLVGLVWAWVAYQITLNAATGYADLIESAFDTQRWELYNALHFKLPSNATDEVTFGEQVTEYLWRGTITRNMRFKHPK